MEIDLVEINDSGVDYYIGVPSTTQVTRFSGTPVHANTNESSAGLLMTNNNRRQSNGSKTADNNNNNDQLTVKSGERSRTHFH